MRIAVYIRVSTQEQADDGFSIEGQKRRLLSFAESQDWTIQEIYIDDGYSAKDLDRPNIRRLIEDAGSEKFELVLVYKLDRMTRSTSDCDYLLKLFEKNNIKFQSCTEAFETRTAAGRLFIRLVADIAQWERETIAERTRFGMEQMVHEGKRPGAVMPYGYDSSGKVVEGERVILHELRRLYMDGDGFKRVAVLLNQKGMMKRGVSWGANSVYYVLDNPYYAGKIRWGGKKTNGKYATRKKEELTSCIIVDSNHETIFTWDEYTEHTNRMKRRSFNGFTKKREYWFTGVLKCAKCGSAMSGRYHENKRQDGSKHRMLSYMCANRQMGEGCTMPLFRQELVEHLVMEWIDNYKSRLDTERVKLMQQKSKKEQKRSESELTNLRKELNKAKERKKKWQYMFVEELISEQDYRQRKVEEDQNESAVQEQIDSFQQAAAVTESESVLLMLQLPDLWRVIDDKDKNEMVTTIFKCIEVDTPLERAHGRKGKFIPALINKVEYN